MLRQVATLPYRINDSGQTRVMLITSRDTRRWVIPKGNLMPGLSLQKAAAKEAFEEAGLTGVASAKSLGKYRYNKRQKNGSALAAVVKVFAFAVEAQAETWPERSQRDTKWFNLEDAAAAVVEPDLKAIIIAFRLSRPTQK